MRLKFKNPPINELIIGAFFEHPVMALRAEHVGVFWTQIRREFPTIQQQPELMAPLSDTFNLQIGSSDEPYPMPRFWLVSADDSMIIQIQKNAFLFNWRKREGEYPHFDALKSKFDEYFDKFSDFMSKEIFVEGLNIRTVELTYSNVIEKNDYWSDSDDTKNILPSMSVLDIGVDSAETDFNYLTAYRPASDMTLNVGVRTGRKATDATAKALVIELRAIGVLGSVNKSEADPWYDRAHDVIGSCFKSMTNPNIQKKHWVEV